MKTRPLTQFALLVVALACLVTPAAADGPVWSKVVPNPQRFVNALSGIVDSQGAVKYEAVLDNETGLVWAKSLNKMQQSYWQQAMDRATMQHLGSRGGWRLPTIDELTSLVVNLPTGHPFINISENDCYWSSTTDSANATQAWFVRKGTSEILKGSKTTVGCYYWPVRGGQ